jgi:PAS domain S-box-containing protein
VTFLWSEPHAFTPEERFYCRQVLEPLAAEVASRRAHLARRKSEARYRALFNNANDALFIHDLEGRLLEVNQVACESLGYSRSELLEMTVEALDVQVSGSAVMDRVEKLRQRGHLVFETSHLRRDGTSVPVEVSSRLIDYEGRKAVLSAARDISERLDMERQLQRQERMAAVGQLAGGIAHDFRNFLTTIILYAGMPLSQPDLSPHVKDALQVIASEAEQASALVQQILDFSGRSSMETQPVDLVAFIEEVADILRQTIPESICVELDIGPEASIVEADPTRIQQVLMNLALNARDAIVASRSSQAAEGGELSIALSNVVVPSTESLPISGMAPGEWVHLTVADTGTGMTEEVKNRIFEPFFTTKERGEGTGLGLAQVYGIVQQHQGHIDVQTELGVGTAFHVYLPAGIEEAAQGAEQEEPGPGRLPQGQGETVLLVEDQQNLREAGRATLTSLGYRVLAAADGREALEMLEGFRVDLVVTDVVMPELGGKALRAELARFHPRLPVLAVTGYTMKEEVRELNSAGFFDVLQKPFDPSSLAQAVRRALDAR